MCDTSSKGTMFQLDETLSLDSWNINILGIKVNFYLFC